MRAYLSEGVGDDAPWVARPAAAGPCAAAAAPAQRFRRRGFLRFRSYGSGSSTTRTGTAPILDGDASYRDSAYGDGSHKDGAYDADAPGSGASAAGSAPATGGRAAAGAQASRSSRRRGGWAQRTGITRFLKIAAISTAVLVLATAGVGYLFYQHLNGNITSVSLTNGAGKDSGVEEKVDAFGRSPINLLVMGSDGRTSAADCKLGGGCSKTGVQTGRTRTWRWWCTYPPTAPTRR